MLSGGDGGGGGSGNLSFSISFYLSCFYTLPIMSVTGLLLNLNIQSGMK